MKNIFVLLFLLLGGIIYGQVSINTLNPLSGVLHIDSSGDNGTGTPTSVQTSDDIFISNSGYVGVGHAVPQAQFHLKTSDQYNGSIKIEDGSQFNARVLRSDANGKSVWAYAGEVQTVYAQLGSGINVLLSTINVAVDIFTDTQGYIYLNPGMWLVTCSMSLNFQTSETTSLLYRCWIRSSFSDIAGGSYSADIVGPKYASGVAYSIGYGQLNGFIVIHNQTSAIKRYYYVLAYSSKVNSPTDSILMNFAKGGVEGNTIIAYKMKDN
ncbi:hypothetical protein [Dysgonomonas macrotermitis]|uniref:Uncharacterized protein n=1 Tax=Dysgonomonas macrotermitis TaxID=1346286 RepID=A0A1M5EE52_9BACT|nr:hypothetical protein [Dysgonomonas macrotermitis]SHF77361.1 hypothetical protein SAMN05444362_1105 [Dysgonomonas macrotermitis]